MRRAEQILRILRLLPAVLVSTAIGACSDMYFDHRDTVSFQSGNAVAANVAVQTIDPWPPGAADQHIPGEGQRVRSAIARYRENKVTPPQGTETSSVGYTPASSGSPAATTGAAAN